MLYFLTCLGLITLMLMSRTGRIVLGVVFGGGFLLAVLGGGYLYNQEQHARIEKVAYAACAERAQQEYQQRPTTDAFDAYLKKRGITPPADNTISAYLKREGVPLSYEITAKCGDDPD